MNRDAITFRVKGRVQGVSFRWFTRQVADELGVSGWVRNRADGDVEGEAFGSPPDLERFLERLRQGPPAATVQDLKYRAIARASTPDIAPTNFEIRR